MKKLITVLAVVFVFVSGCKKEEIDKCKATACQNGGSCNPTNGSCNCPAGYYGVQCQFQEQACSTNHTGTLIFVNTHDDPYYIDINGVYSYYISAYSSLTIPDYPKACFSTRETQASGYVFYPTIYNGSHCVNDCQTTTVSF